MDAKRGVRQFAVHPMRLACFIAFSFAAFCLPSNLFSQEETRAQLEMAQKRAELAYKSYIDSGKTDAAIDELFQCIRDFETLCLGYEGDGRHRFRLNLAKLRKNTCDDEGAHQLFLEIERDAKPGSEDRIEARAFLFVIQALSGVVDRKAGIDILEEAMPLEASNGQLYNELQFNILNRILQLDSVRGSTTPYDAKKEELGNVIAALQQEMREAGLPEEVVKLADFQKVALADSFEDFETLASTLNELQPAVESPSIAPHWIALLWNKWVDLHLKQRNYSAAFIAHQKFETASALAEDVELTVVCLSQKALLYLRMGDYASARRLLEETRLFQLGSPYLDQSTNWRVNMSKALEGDREFLQARDILQEGIEFLSSSESGNDQNARFLQINLLNNLGINHYLTGDLDRAAALLEESRTIIERLSLTKQMVAAESMINLGWIELARNRPENSARVFREAAKLVSEIATENHVRFAEALTGAARSYLALGDRNVAVKLIRRAEKIAYQKLTDDLRAIFDPRDRIAILQETRVHPESIAWPGVFDTYMELAVPLELPVAEQFDVLMRWKGVLNRRDFASQRDSHYRNLNQVQELEKQLSEVYFRRVSVLQKKKQQQEIRTIESQLQNLRRAQTAQDLGSSKLEESRDSKSVLASLKADTAIVSIVQIRTYRKPQANQAIGTKGEFVGFVAKDGKITRIALGEVDEVEAAVSQWLKFISARNDDDSERKAAKRVADILQNPLMPFLSGIGHLAIHADGITHSLPWGALPGVGKSKYWVEDLSFSNVIDLKQSKSGSKSPAQPSLLVVGNVDYGPLSDSWDSLLGTLGEIQGVVETFEKKFPTGQSASLSETHADKRSVIEKMAGRRFAHFATHGLYLRKGSNDAFGLVETTSTLDSGLVLAAQADVSSPAGQFLTASDVMALDLGKTELVVLSACETGLGKLKAGQGIDGLVSSFHSAGVEQVVSSLWQVDDLKTKELMTRFYKNLWELELTPTEAMRKAQIDLLRKSDLSAPYYWAAFTVSTRELAN